jgi:hypothetical protein
MSDVSFDIDRTFRYMIIIIEKKIDNTYPGQSPEFPLGHLIPQVRSASSQEVPQKKVCDGSSASYVGLSAVSKIMWVMCLAKFRMDLRSLKSMSEWKSIHKLALTWFSSDTRTVRGIISCFFCRPRSWLPGRFLRWCGSNGTGWRSVDMQWFLLETWFDSEMQCKSLWSQTLLANHCSEV